MELTQGDPLTQYVRTALDLDNRLRTHLRANTDFRVEKTPEGIVRGDIQEVCRLSSNVAPGSGDPVYVSGLQQGNKANEGIRLMGYMVADGTKGEAHICRVQDFNIAKKSQEKVREIVVLDLIVGAGFWFRNQPALRGKGSYKFTIHRYDGNAVLNLPAELFDLPMQEALDRGVEFYLNTNVLPAAQPESAVKKAQRKAASAEARSPLATVVATPAHKPAARESLKELPIVSPAVPQPKPSDLKAANDTIKQGFIGGLAGLVMGTSEAAYNKAAGLVRNYNENRKLGLIDSFVNNYMAWKKGVKEFDADFESKRWGEALWKKAKELLDGAKALQAKRLTAMAAFDELPESVKEDPTSKVNAQQEVIDRSSDIPDLQWRVNGRMLLTMADFANAANTTARIQAASTPAALVKVLQDVMTLSANIAAGYRELAVGVSGSKNVEQSQIIQALWAEIKGYKERQVEWKARLDQLVRADVSGAIDTQLEQIAATSAVGEALKSAKTVMDQAGAPSFGAATTTVPFAAGIAQVNAVVTAEQKQLNNIVSTVINDATTAAASLAPASTFAAPLMPASTSSFTAPLVPSTESSCGSCQNERYIRVNDNRKDCYCGNQRPPPDGRPYCSRLKCFHKGFGGRF